MPNIAKLLKDEIKRIAKKEIKSAVWSVSKKGAKLRRYVAELRRRTARLEKECLRLAKRLEKTAKIGVTAPDGESSDKAGRIRATAKTIITLRKKLGLSQADFAKLLGVATQSVFQWEHRSGSLPLRKKARAAIFAAKGIGAREAKKRLAEMGVSAKKRGGRRKK